MRVRIISSLILAVFIAVNILPLAVSAFAEDINEENFIYTITNNSVVVTGCKNPVGDIVIPSMLDGYPVTEIQGFKNYSGITSITIPESVSTIWFPMFEGCSNLTNVIVDANNSVYASIEGVLFNKDKTRLLYYPARKDKEYEIPYGVNKIGAYAFNNRLDLEKIIIPETLDEISGNEFSGAFDGCTGLTSIIIPASVIKIGWFAFRECTSLTQINIPHSVTEIGSEAFTGCTSLKNITVDNKNPNYSSLDGILCNKDKTELIQYPSAKGNIYSIPSNITKISSKAFYKNSNITNIDFPKSLQVIASDTFNGCTSLDNVILPNNLIAIGMGAFENCTSLTNITIPNSVTKIEDSIFSGCTNLTNITIPSSVTEIGNSVFSGCTNLTNVLLPQSITSISKSMFSGCKALENIVIPDLVTSIHAYAFSSCESLEKIVLPSELGNIGKAAFLGCSNIENITIPNSVTEIGDNAFFECTKLKNILLPKNITSISRSMLSGCKSLESITIPDLVTSVPAYAFSGCESLKEILLPQNIESIGYAAFSDCIKLNHVFLPDGIKKIENKAFVNTAIYNDFKNWEDGVLYIGKYLIRAKTRNPSPPSEPVPVPGVGLPSGPPRSLPDSILSFKSVVSEETSVISLATTFKEESLQANCIIRYGTVGVADYAFYGCSEIETLVIPCTVKYIGASALASMRNFKSILYCSSSEDWEKIDVGNYRPSTNTTIYYNYILPMTQTDYEVDIYKNMINIRVSIPNVEISPNSVLFACGYDDGILKDFKIKTISKGNYNEEFSLSYNNINQIKVLVWKDINSGAPLLLSEKVKIASETK